MVLSVWGWYTVDNDDLTPSNFRSSLKAIEANWGPQSDINLSGNPNRLYRFSNSSWPVSSAVIVFEQEIRIIPFVSPWSIITKMESWPWTGGKSVMKSIEQFPKGRVEEATSVGTNASLAGRWSNLNCWQVPHSFWCMFEALATSSVAKQSCRSPILLGGQQFHDHGTFLLCLVEVLHFGECSSSLGNTEPVFHRFVPWTNRTIDSELSFF